MKGMVFTQFLDMVEEKYSIETLQQVIDDSNLPSGGAYTALGTYDHRELVTLVENLGRRTGAEPRDLVRAFGEQLFGKLARLYPQFVAGIDDAFDLIERVEGYVHVEVRKLYPEAELPSFACERPDARTLRMVYSSNRPFADLAEGMIRGCLAHFGGAPVALMRKDLPGEAGLNAEFTLLRRADTGANPNG